MVDLPIPGSPPTRTTEPGTIPPPSTKSNSPSPVVHLRRSVPSTSRRRTGRASAAARFTGAPAEAERLGADGSSTSVFHSRQAGHWPCQRGVSLPHSRQKKAVLVFATPSVLAPARRHALEQRELLAEEERHAAGGAVSLLADDQL